MVTKTKLRNIVFKEGSFIALLSFIFTMMTSSETCGSVGTFLLLFVLFSVIKVLHMALIELTKLAIEEYSDLED